MRQQCTQIVAVSHVRVLNRVIEASARRVSLVTRIISSMARQQRFRRSARDGHLYVARTVTLGLGSHFLSLTLRPWSLVRTIGRQSRRLNITRANNTRGNPRLDTRRTDGFQMGACHTVTRRQILFLKGVRVEGTFVTTSIRHTRSGQLITHHR